MKAYEGRVEPDQFEVDFAKIDTVGRCCILFLVLCCHLCLLVAPFDFLLGRKVHLLLQLTWICHMKKRKRSLRGQSKKVFDHEKTFSSTFCFESLYLFFQLPWQTPDTKAVSTNLARMHNGLLHNTLVKLVAVTHCYDACSYDQLGSHQKGR